MTEKRQSTGILANWSGYTPAYTSWVDTNALYGCTAWSPDPGIYSNSNNFTQTSNTCKTDQERQRQEREQEAYTQEIRNIGEPVTENQTIENQTASRSYAVELGDWTAVGAPYNCSNWSPDVSTIGKGLNFTQHATDCELKQSRTRHESYVDHLTHVAVPVVKPAENRNLINQSHDQSAVGTREDWMPETPIYTAWIDTSALNGCSNWAPLSSSKTSTITFAQTANNCTKEQSRQRQDREKEQNTGEVRNLGAPVTETQTLTDQPASRLYTVTLGNWTDNGAKYDCTNWSPATSTVTVGQSFTQTATNCKQDQYRTRNESYVESGITIPVSVPNETRILTAQSSSQTAVGTMADCRYSEASPITHWEYYQENNTIGNGNFSNPTTSRLLVRFNGTLIYNSYDSFGGTVFTDGTYNYVRGNYAGVLAESPGTAAGPPPMGSPASPHYWKDEYYVCKVPK